MTCLRLTSKRVLTVHTVHVVGCPHKGKCSWPSSDCWVFGTAELASVSMAEHGLGTVAVNSVEQRRLFEDRYSTKQKF